MTSDRGRKAWPAVAIATPRRARMVREGVGRRGPAGPGRGSRCGEEVLDDPAYASEPGDHFTPPCGRPAGRGQPRLRHRGGSRLRLRPRHPSPLVPGPASSATGTPTTAGLFDGGNVVGTNFFPMRRWTWPSSSRTSATGSTTNSWATTCTHTRGPGPGRASGGAALGVHVGPSEAGGPRHPGRRPPTGQCAGRTADVLPGP